MVEHSEDQETARNKTRGLCSCLSNLEDLFSRFFIEEYKCSADKGVKFFSKRLNYKTSGD